MIDLSISIGNIGLIGVAITEPILASLSWTKCKLSIDIFEVNAGGSYFLVVGHTGIARTAITTGYTKTQTCLD